MITLLKSIVVGICAILPGVSGSVIAVSLGIYERVLNILNNPKIIKNNKKFLFLVLLGIFIGVFFTSNIFVYILKYKCFVYYSLIGIILSEIPFLIKKMGGLRNINKISLIVSFLLSLLLDLLNKKEIVSSYSSIKYFFGGILFSFGKVFPGVSSSFFLLCLGIYENIIILITKPILLITNIKLYLPFLLGSIIGFFIFLSILSYLLKYKFEFVYSMIIGFMLSSIIILIPKSSSIFENIAGILLMSIFFILFVYIKAKKDE